MKKMYTEKALYTWRIIKMPWEYIICQRDICLLGSVTYRANYEVISKLV